jgi:GDP-L-fucose synthase
VSHAVPSGSEIDRKTKIFVAGHRGLVGSAIVRMLQRLGFANLVLPSRRDLDLTRQSQVERFFEVERPEIVYLAAAKVGGILANKNLPADFLFDNLAIQTNIIHSAYRSGVDRLLFLGSSCIYPRLAAQPLKEECLLSGPLEPTNRPYAVAKIAGIEMCWAYNREFGTKYLAVMPTNLYGPGDEYDLESSHVIPALIRKMHEAKSKGLSEVVFWGSGTPRREFLYSDDLAEACVFLMGLENDRFLPLVQASDEPPIINIGCGQDQTIRELARLIADVVGFQGVSRYDLNKPDGTPQKLLDITRLASLGWRPRHDLRQGLKLAYEDFLHSHIQPRAFSPVAQAPSEGCGDPDKVAGESQSASSL